MKNFFNKIIELYTKLNDWFLNINRYIQPVLLTVAAVVIVSIVFILDAIFGVPAGLIFYACVWIIWFGVAFIAELIKRKGV